MGIAFDSLYTAIWVFKNLSGCFVFGLLFPLLFTIYI